jgi:hypothetical protein
MILDGQKMKRISHNHHPFSPSLWGFFPCVQIFSMKVNERNKEKVINMKVVLVVCFEVEEVLNVLFFLKVVGCVCEWDGFG